MAIVVRLVPLIFLYLAVVTDGAPCCMACNPCCCGCGGGGYGEDMTSVGNRADSGYYSAYHMEPTGFEGADEIMRGAKAPRKGKPAKKPAAKPGKAKPAKAPAKPAKAPAKPAKAPAKPAKGAAKPAKGAAKPAKGPAKPAKGAAKPGAAPAAGFDPAKVNPSGVGPIRYTSTKEEDAARQIDPPPLAPTNVKVKPVEPVYWDDAVPDPKL